MGGGGWEWVVVGGVDGGGWLLEKNIIIKMYKFRSHRYKNKCEGILVIYFLKDKITKSPKNVGPIRPRK